MYLKCIEVQGFKSFANKIVFQFHEGITAIVGPNGSGKSNVADAVRWVLGEQRVKQLRGGSMQDIIFAGTENRRPMGYAYVAITLDNSDHSLPISYDEVTVARRLYRSGESEYLLNGTQCRLKDVNELFYDTGIGKEGYSIIGQGQIEKIISGKPEERRELFDEAAGIVKYKRRKLAAQKKLEDEQQNLVRVNDILAELTRQLGPMERQAEKAKVYLKKKEELKIYDVNMFLSDLARLKEELEAAAEKKQIAEHDLEQSRKEYEQAREDYEKLEAELEELEQERKSQQEKVTGERVRGQQLENQIALLKEQINTASQTGLHMKARLDAVEKELREKEESLQQIRKKRQELLSQGQALLEENDRSEQKHRELDQKLQEQGQQMEQDKNEVIRLLGERTSIKARQQRFRTMLEQLEIRKARISQQILELKSKESDQHEEQERCRREYDGVTEEIRKLNEKSGLINQELAVLQERLTSENQEIEKEQAEYHREASRLESLRNITERYDGYGNSIRRVMEQKDREKGILGVTADLIKTRKEYETAVETALGGSIQNIVTRDEDTAKRMIEYLKRNKFGRATFLPLTALKNKGGFSRPEALREPGVIGLASSLVTADKLYEPLVEYLLGKTVVADQIDHAVAIARKYHYTLRIVTLEGESLSPGGSMTGGAFKNSSNLLGRRREIEELKGQVEARRKKLEELRSSVDECRSRRNGYRESLVSLSEELQIKYIEQNTAGMKLKEVENQKNQTLTGYQQIRGEQEEIIRQAEELRQEQTLIETQLEESQSREEELNRRIEQCGREQEELRSQESLALGEVEQCHLKLAALKQEETFTADNEKRVEDEMEALRREQQSIQESAGDAASQIEEKEGQIVRIREELREAGESVRRAEEYGSSLDRRKEEKSGMQKAFFQKREELSERSSLLDRECFRLNSQIEKLEETKEGKIAYMWDEYELTGSMAAEMKKEDLGTDAEIRRRIQELKGEIRNLGSVNVNAIEDYKELSERHGFLSSQHEDLVKSEQALQKIIEDLDTGMRVQFRQQFGRIQTEFDKAFKQLFGGGKGTLELVEEEDILEAGVRIIAQPPGKKLQNMMQLSGGEKSLTAIALLFAIQNLKPSPFCLLDEIEAALDESNVGRYAGYLHKLTKHTQFIIITHRRGTMAAADRLYGITMQEKGISALVSVNLIEEKLDQ